MTFLEGLAGAYLAIGTAIVWFDMERGVTIMRAHLAAKADPLPPWAAAFGMWLAAMVIVLTWPFSTYQPDDGDE